MKCPSCDNLLSNGDLFCTRCGARVNEPCPRCGAVVPAGDKACTKCGHDVSQPHLLQGGVHAGKTEAAPVGRTSAEPAQKVCPRCSATNHQGARFCYSCGLTLEGVLPVASTSRTPAGFWIRLAAYMIDQILLYLVLIVVFSLLESTGVISFKEIDSANLFDPKLNLLGLFIEGTYFTIFTGLEGQTLGKRILGLRVLRTNGDRISYLRSLGRYLSYFISSIIFGLGFLAIAFSESKRGWHDRICDTMVVREQRPPKNLRGNTF